MFWLGHTGVARVSLAVAATAPLFWFAQSLRTAWRAAIFLALFFAGLWASAAFTATTALVDDGRIVIDEVVGAAFVLFVLRPTRVWAAAAMLVVYVALDRAKPWPIHLSEAIPGAPGVMLDDLAAALPVVLAVLVARLVLRRAG